MRRSGSASFERYSRSCASEEGLRDKSVRGAFYMGTAGGVEFVVRLGATLILARILAPEDFGVVAMVMALTGLVDMFKDLGLSTATVQRKCITHEEISSLFWINASFGGTMALLFCATAPAISWFYGDDRLVTVTPALASTLLWGALSVQHEALLTRQLKQGPLALIRLIGSVVSSCLGIALALRGLGYWALVLREVARSLIVMAGIWWSCRWIPALLLRPREVRGFLKFGRDLTMANVLMAAIGKLDGILVGKFFGPVALGAYRQAQNLITAPVDQFNAPVFSVAQPGLSALQSDPDRYRRYYQRVVGLVASVTMPLGILVAAYAEELTLFLLGEKWTVAIPFLAVFGVAAAIGPTITTVGIVMVTLGRTRLLLWLIAAHSLVLTALMFVGLHWGAIGIACAHVAATVVLLGPKIHYGFKNSPVDVFAFGSSIRIAVLSSAIMVTALFLLRLALPIDDLVPRLFAGCGVGAVSYLLPWMLLPSGRAELQVLVQDVHAALLHRRPPARTDMVGNPREARTAG